MKDSDILFEWQHVTDISIFGYSFYNVWCLSMMSRWFHSFSVFIIYELSNFVFLIYICVYIFSRLLFWADYCLNPDSSLCRGKYFCVSLLFRKDNIWYGSPMVSLSSLVRTWAFQDLISWYLYQHSAFQHIRIVVWFIAFK